MKEVAEAFEVWKFEEKKFLGQSYVQDFDVFGCNKKINSIVSSTKKLGKFVDVR